VLAGRYKVVDEIGRGGMGIVYRVEHVHTGEPLALKLLVGAARSDPQALKRFKREARTSARIRSEHVVHIGDADTSPELDGSPFFVMELLHGMDVGKYATQHGPLEPAELVALLAQVGSVLETAHGLGIVHRDLKPENLFLHQRKDGTTTAKVLDFGISKFASEDQALETGMTATGLVLGTPLYMAPEQAHGQNDKIAPTTDVWAIGLIAMRLLTGEHYWGAPTMADLMMKIAVLPILPPSERWPDSKRMSPALDAWFLRSCDRDQAKRWPTVAMQIRELAAAFGIALPSPVSGALTFAWAVPSNLPTSTAARARWPRSRQVVLGLAASVACAAIVLAGRGKSQTTAPSAPSNASYSRQERPPAPIVSVAAPVTAVVAPSASPASPQPSAAAPSSRPTTRDSKPRLAPPSPAPAAASSSAPLYAPLAP
jgi:serine/threonine-protein kinase